MNYKKVVDELIANLFDLNDYHFHYDRKDMEEIIRRHAEEPIIKLTIEDCKVRNVVTGEIK